MSVNWRWKSKVGEVIYKDLKTGKQWKLQMFTGNMMFAFIYKYRKVDEETGKLAIYYNFFTWFNDMAHAKKCFKNDKTFLNHMAVGNHKYIKTRIFITNKELSPYSKTEILRYAKLLAEYGYKVELY